MPQEHGTSGIVWQNPPNDNRGRRSNKYAAVADELRANPGRWALISQGKAVSIAANLRRGTSPAFRPSDEWDFRATVTDHERNTGDVYARFVGDV